MNRFQLKIIACTSMLVSHTGLILSSFVSEDVSMLFYLFGRIAFPLFAFFISDGWNYTRNKIKYMRNLLVFAFISQIPYMLYIDKDGLNVLFTLLIGTTALWIYDRTKNSFLLPLCFTPVFFASFLNLDYGWKGVLLILLFGIIQKKNVKLIVLIILLGLIYLPKNQFVYDMGFIVSMLSLFLLLFYNGESGSKKFKYLFYLFYPLHLILLCCVSLILW